VAVLPAVEGAEGVLRCGAVGVAAWMSQRGRGRCGRGRMKIQSVEDRGERGLFAAGGAAGVTGGRSGGAWVLPAARYRWKAQRIGGSEAGSGACQSEAWRCCGRGGRARERYRGWEAWRGDLRPAKGSEEGMAWRSCSSSLGGLRGVRMFGCCCGCGGLPVPWVRSVEGPEEEAGRCGCGCECDEKVQKGIGRCRLCGGLGVVRKVQRDLSAAGGAVVRVVCVRTSGNLVFSRNSRAPPLEARTESKQDRH
jgi:hypothetical protein